MSYIAGTLQRGCRTLATTAGSSWADVAKSVLGYLEFSRYGFIMQYPNLASTNSGYKSPESLVQMADVPVFVTGSPIVAPLKKAARSSCPLLPLELSAR